MFKTILTILLLCNILIAPAQDAITRGKKLFGDMRGRHIGPALVSGRITDLELHPSNARILYAGTAGGGVWKSQNGGAMFEPVFDDHCQSIGVVTLDPSDPDNVVWVGTGEVWTRNSVSVGDGIYKSVDGGANWKNMGLKASERIASIEVNPNNPLEVYVAVMGPLWSDSEERGLYKTSDGGKSWSKILYVNASTGCSDLIMDPQNPQILYAAFWEFRRTPWSFQSGGKNSALYKSTDGGTSFTKIHNGFPKGELGRLAIALAPSDPSRLYAVIESEKDTDKGIYSSNDGGDSWAQQNGDFGTVVRPFYFSRIEVDPRDPDKVVKAGVFGSISRDGGKTFKNLGSMHPDIHDIVFDIKDSDRMYVATDGGVYRSWDGGTTLELVENIPVSQFYHISVDNEEPYNVYGGLQDNGCWYGPSDSPGGIEARDWNYVGYGDGYRVYRHATKNLIYSEMQGAQQVWRYDPAKNQARSIQPLPAEGQAKFRFNWNASLTTSPNKPDRVYLGSQFVHRSEDMGETWEIISPDLTTNNPAKQNQADSGGLSQDNSGAENHCTIFTIAESPLDENIIWAGTDDGNIQLSRDGGKTWTNLVANVPGLPANTMVYHIEASVFGKGKAYAVFTGYQTGDMNTYVYKTSDFGATWKSIVTPDITAFARNLQEDYEQEDLLFLGTELGLYVTLDGGATWNKFTNNVPPASIHFIDLQKSTHDLVLGTHGRGVLIIDDISPLRQLTPDRMSKELYFFASEPTTINESNGFGGTSAETQFVGENPSKAVQIKYHMKRRHFMGKMTMEIQDADGNTLSDLTPGKSQGINVVSWPYRIKPPRVAKARTFAFGGFTRARVPAGAYKAVIKKGKKVFSTDFTIQYDPESTVSLTDRNKQEEATKTLYDMCQDLAYMVYTLDEYVKLGKQAKKQNPRSAKTSDRFVGALDNLKQSLVITTGDNYVGKAEDQLREKMADLYGKVAESFFRPSRTELDNLASIKKQFAEAKESYEGIKEKYLPKINRYLAKDKPNPTVMKSFQEYLETEN